MNTINDVSKIGNACFSGQGAKFASSNPRGCDHRWISVFDCPDFNSIKYLVTCCPPPVGFPIAIVLCSPLQLYCVQLLPSCTAP